MNAAIDIYVRNGVIVRAIDQRLPEARVWVRAPRFWDRVSRLELTDVEDGQVRVRLLTADTLAEVARGGTWSTNATTD